MLIYLKGLYAVLGKINYNGVSNEFTFYFPSDQEKSVKIVIRKDQGVVETSTQFEATEETVNLLQSNVIKKEQVVELVVSEDKVEILDEQVRDAEKLPDPFREELRLMNISLIQPVREILNLIKYTLNQTELQEPLFSICELLWSLDETTWKPLPQGFQVIISDVNNVYLNEESAQLIQTYINSNFKPFIALSFLHKAKNEDMPQYKWIYATIAAEIAIKEFLIEKRPEYETLLLEIPAPPLAKLYGSILESIIHERSPVVNQIRKGVETRNQLIHRPNAAVVTLPESIQYVYIIEYAIYHLLDKLYPDDANIQSLLRQAKNLSQIRN